MPATTEIIISGITIPNAAILAPSITVAWRDNGELRQDCNGTLHDLTLTTHRKREITVTLADQVRAPAMFGIWRGALVSITLPPHLLGDVAGSSIACMIENYETERDEFGARTGWTLTLWEI